MAKRRKRTAARSWTGKLDKDDVRAARGEAFIDAYGEYEQHSGLLTMIEEEMEFPFPAQVIGEAVTVTGMAWPDDDAFGLDFICERQGKSYPIEARSVEPVDPLPEGHVWIAAYLTWKASF